MSGKFMSYMCKYLFCMVGYKFGLIFCRQVSGNFLSRRFGRFLLVNKKKVLMIW